MRVYLVDENQEAANVFTSLGGTGVPEFYFIGEDGSIQNHMIGYEGDAALEKYTNALLK